MEMVSNYLLLFSLCIFLVGMGVYIFWNVQHCKFMKKKTIKTDVDCKIIKQQIKLTDNKIVDLEIRVGILEDKVDE
jgi:hypothetical protein